MRNIELWNHLSSVIGQSVGDLNKIGEMQHKIIP